MAEKYIIGTRGSLLALTQCTQIKNQLEEATGDKFELKVIRTEGDENTILPLWQLDGKDFFTKELDAALLKGEVDLVVHSYKDLGSERPEGLALAAITQRVFSDDVLLFKKEIIQKAKAGNPICVGTSSPRRSVNLEKYLPEIFPYCPVVTTSNLRGNVNTRIQKLRDGKYDAICLALAGIERLAGSPESKKELEFLLNGLTFMVLPGTLLPSAASQGALAIECLQSRSDQGRLMKKLESVHHLQTAEEMERERKAFQTYGGGCHLAVGIQVNKIKNEFIQIEKGEVDNSVVDKLDFSGTIPCLKGPVFLGTAGESDSDQIKVLHDQLIAKRPLPVKNRIESENSLFISSPHCFEALDQVFGGEPLFCSGIRTMKKLAKKGYLVHAASDYSGAASMKLLESSKALEIMLGQPLKWTVLTNDQSSSELGVTFPCYTREVVEPDARYEEQLEKVESFFWSSFYQYKTFTEKYPFIRNKTHCSGMGKTYDTFLKEGIEVVPFPSAKQFNEAIE